MEGRGETRARALCVELEHEPAVMLASFQLTIAPKRQRGPGLEAVSQGNARGHLMVRPARCRFPRKRAGILVDDSTSGAAVVSCPLKAK
jgi:hypothetical protein